MATDRYEFVINNQYKLVKRIGGGSFGEIFEAVNTKVTPGSPFRLVAAKLERSGSRHPQLLQEYGMYKGLAADKKSKQEKLPRTIGIPRAFFYGQESGYNVLVMELLGPSLEDLFNYCGERLSIPTVTALAEQMIERVWYLHEKQWVHRDIKPDNFLMGVEDQHDTVYIIDYGLSKKYIKDRQHLKFREGKSLTGTARYAGCNVHRGYEQSRRDDLEALGYVFLYFLRGRLPWQGMNARSRKEKYEKIAERKYSTPTEVLCDGFPAAFASYLDYCKSLEFEQTPDYLFLIRLFRDLRKSSSSVFVFDWIEMKNTAERAKRRIDGGGGMATGMRTNQPEFGSGRNL